MKYSNTRIARFFKIPILNSYTDLANSLRISSRTLYSLINLKDYHYKEVAIPKNNGELRILKVPSFTMKVVQRWIYEEILANLPVSSVSMAFVPGKNGLVKTAELHKNYSNLLSMDIHNFFDSISKKSVRSFFYSLGYSFEIANLLTELCTYNGSLPQGAVTSPCLANLVCQRLDARIIGLCNKRNIVYSRYADDLCFSSDNQLNLNKIVPIISEIVKDEGFEINSDKTHFSSDYSHKTVLGLTINDHSIHVSKEFKRELRSMIFNSISRGNYKNRNKILGSIAYITSIEPECKTKIIGYIHKLSSQELICRNKKLVDAYNANKFFKYLPDAIYIEDY